MHDLFGLTVEAAIYFALIAAILCFKEPKKAKKVTVRALDEGIYEYGEAQAEVSSKLRAREKAKECVTLNFNLHLLHTSIEYIYIDIEYISDLDVVGMTSRNRSAER